MISPFGSGVPRDQDAHPAAGNAGFALLFQNGSLWPGVPEPGVRWHSDMSVCGYKRLTVALAVLCALLAFVSVFLFIGYAPLKLRLAFASEQVLIFDQMRDKALHSDASGAAGCLEYVVNYYPSGTKQESGSRLDRMVESARAQSVREILAYLRTKTGEDLGTDPESWIEKYAKR